MSLFEPHHHVEHNFPDVIHNSYDLWLLKINREIYEYVPMNPQKIKPPKDKHKQNITTLSAKIYLHLIDIPVHNINVLQYVMIQISKSKKKSTWRFSKEDEEKEEKKKDKGTCSNSRQESTVNMHSCREEDFKHMKYYKKCLCSWIILEGISPFVVLDLIRRKKTLSGNKIQSYLGMDHVGREIHRVLSNHRQHEPLLSNEGFELDEDFVILQTKSN